MRAVRLARVALVVDRYALGPLQTNCYVVRARARCAGGSRRRPGRRCRRAPARSSRGVARRARRSCHARPLRPSRRRRRPRRGHRRAGVHARGRARPSRALRASSRRPACRGRSYTPDHLLEGGETIDVAGHRRSSASRSRALARARRLPHRRRLFSGDLLFAGSVGRVDLPGADWDTLLASVRMLADRYPPETVVYPGHGPETTLGAELERNPFLAELRA